MYEIGNRVACGRFLTCLRRQLSQVNEWIGKALAWLVLVMVLTVMYDVIMRYFFSSGSIAFQELSWHLFSLIFLLGAGYTFKHDEHVRLDLLYKSRYLSDRQSLWVDIIGGLFLLIPFCLLMVISSWPFVYQAFVYSEGSPDPGGLSNRWILKACIPLGFIFLSLQALADVLEKLDRIRLGQR